MKKYIYIAFAALSVASCKLDDNISQNDPSVEQVNPNLYLSAALTSNYSVETGDILELSNIWMNNWAGNVYYYASPYSAEYQLQVTSAFAKGNNFWNNSYLAMARYAAIYNSPQADKYPHHSAIAKIMMANSMQYIVDFFGDAPFSDAFKREGNLTPKYDKGEDIYKNLVLMINEANQAIDATAIPLNEVGTEDEIYAGDMAKWKKLANTIKLRLLLRQSKVTDPTVKSFVTAQLQTLQGAQFITAADGNATINPSYNSSNAAQQNPLVRNYSYLNFDQATENLTGYRLIDLSSHFAGLLNGTDTKTAISDGRRGMMYRAVGGTLRGITQGAGQIAGTTEASFSRMGWKYYQVVSGRLKDNSNMDGYIMTVAESELLQAEAAELYPAIFSNALGHYNNAVTASFNFYEVPATAANPTPAATYLANLSTKPYGWNGADGHIAAIQYQRMVALHYIKPQETYVNYLKTGFPITPLAITATQPNKPWRLVYPAREYNTNSANVPNVTQADIFVKNQFTPFWNRN